MFGAFLDADSGAELQDVVLDVVESIGYALSGQATTSPVGREQTRQTDHWIDAPDVLTITASVHDARPGRDTVVGRSREIYRRLKSWKSEGRRLGFVSGLEVYPEVLIIGVDTTEDGDHETHLDLVIRIQEIDTASALVEEIPPEAPDPDAAPTKPTKRQRQRQNTKTPDAATEKRGSILYNAFFT